jgi:myo-inositol-1(or 4)-monophosphatase
MTATVSGSGLADRLHLAIELAIEAGRLAAQMRRAPERLGVEAKSARDLVTAADRKVEELIVSRLRSAFGDDVLGEELGRTGGSARLWLVDPIDGTYNYIHDNPRWCVSLGFMSDGMQEIGVIYSPPLDHLYVARRGGGATRNGRPLKVSGSQYATHSLVEVGSSSRRPLSAYLGIVERLMTAGIETRRLGSGALGIAQVATGEIDGYYEDYIHPWDVAASTLVVREAGGFASDYFAGDALERGNRILACAPSLREHIQALIDG